MIPFAMVVINKFSESPSEMALTEWHHPIEALVFDRPHESFSVGVRIGRPKWRQRDVHAGILQLPTYLPAPLPVTIADQHTMVAQQAIDCGQRATALARKTKPSRRERADPYINQAETLNIRVMSAILLCRKSELKIGGGHEGFLPECRS